MSFFFDDFSSRTLWRLELLSSHELRNRDKSQSKSLQTKLDLKLKNYIEHKSNRSFPCHQLENKYKKPRKNMTALDMIINTSIYQFFTCSIQNFWIRSESFHFSNQNFVHDRLKIYIQVCVCQHQIFLFCLCSFLFLYRLSLPSHPCSLWPEAEYNMQATASSWIKVKNQRKKKNKLCITRQVWS